MKIQILGTGCPRCLKLGQEAEKAAQQLGIAYEIEKITDVPSIMRFGVMSTPALAVNGVVKVSGRVPSVAEIKALLS